MEFMSKLKGLVRNVFGAVPEEFEGESNVEAKDMNVGLLAIVV